MNWEAWAAGLFEGEGCLTWTTASGRKYPTASASSTDLDVLEKFRSVIGIGAIYSNGSFTHKQVWVWKINGITNIRILSEIVGPYLGERRSKRLAELLSWEPAPKKHRDDVSSRQEEPDDSSLPSQA